MHRSALHVASPRCVSQHLDVAVQCSALGLLFCGNVLQPKPVCGQRTVGCCGKVQCSAVRTLSVEVPKGRRSLALATNANVY